jgi:hypothetical protein
VTAPPVIAVRCHYCSKWRAPRDLHRLSGHAQAICADCLSWHFRAMDFLAGGPPPGCQECLATWEILRERAPGDEVRLYVVPRDGIYQMLCADCVRPYIRKRKDLYGDTAFGARIKL